MSNRFFDDDESDAVHPKASVWLERIAQGQKATMTLWRKRDGLMFKPAEIHIAFETPNGKQMDDYRWDVDVNEVLVKAGVRAESSINEAQRLSLMFRYWFSKPEEDFGPGFFESILIGVLHGPEFATKTAVTDRLQQIAVYDASREGRSYDQCKKRIEDIIKRAARALMDQLKYPQEQSEDILAEALGQYLDERFHITERRMLGWG